MPNYKLLALDIDGTLITDEGRLTGVTKESIGRAVEAGTTVMLTTGRAFQRTEGIRSELGLRGPMVLLNGAEIWREPSDLLERHYIANEKRRQLYQIAVDSDAWYWATSIHGALTKKAWPDDAFANEWMKFGIGHTNHDVLKEITETIQEWDVYEVTSSHRSNIEVGPKGRSKATGLETICNQLDITMADVMAIGDSRNDMHMIESVGFGVAMGNANPEVKEIADAVTSSNEDDGVARAIEKYLLASP